MDLDRTEDLNKVRPSVYCASLKLRSLQKLCQMHMVLIQDLRHIFCAEGGSENSTQKLSQDTLRQSLEQLFLGVLQKLPSQVVQDATEQTTRLLFKLYDRQKAGFVYLRSVEAALIVLSGDTLVAKDRALFQLAVCCSRNLGIKDASVSLSSLWALLDDLSQIPAVVQENHVFGSVESAINSCFKDVNKESVGEEHFLSWLMSEPRLLLWISTLYRISVSETVQHRVHCHICKAFPIAGLRYRCLKCLNVHVCQNCFLTKRFTRKHKLVHPVLEYCTQPSWKESIASLASSARHALRPRHYTRGESQSRRVIRPGSNNDPKNSTYFPEQQECVDVDQSGQSDVSLLENCPSSSLQLKESKGLQTDESDTQPQGKASLLQKDVNISLQAMREMQRDKCTSFPEQQECVDVDQSGQSDVSLSQNPSSPLLLKESKALQTDESVTQPQIKASLPQKDLNTLQAMREMQRDKWLLEKEFQVWKVAAQSEHDLLEDRCTELEDTMKSLIQHNQQLEEQLEQVRHALNSRTRNEYNPDIYTPLACTQQCNKSERLYTAQENPNSQPISISDKREPESEEEEEIEDRVERNEKMVEKELSKDEVLPQVQEEMHIDLAVAESWETMTQKEVEVVQESKTMGLENEEEDKEEEVDDKMEEQVEELGEKLDPQNERQELMLEDPASVWCVEEKESETDVSDEDIEKELCDVVQRLQDALLLPTTAGSDSHQKKALLKAAEEVGDSVFNIVTSIKSFNLPLEDLE
ncbi:dystrotelin [Trichomycterus rosablanca]|uniref:dystrotelin n=1 Tax=Trichomycterus rosablanca TaxID=2290929 RepID=UPI002F359F06